MFCYKLLTVLVVTLSLWDQVRSQRDVVTKMVNGPTGISVEAEVQRLWTESSRNVVNGPTAYSVAAEEGNPGNEGFVEVEEDLESSNEASNIPFEETDVDLDNIDNDEDGGHVIVNGHTGSSVHQDQLMFPARGVISTDPKVNNATKQQRPKGLYHETTDWSTDSSQWTFTGGEWALVSLPDKDNHPTIPAPMVPSPALVVVTQEPFKKVYVYRMVEGLSNVTLHYSYYLSEGKSPAVFPTLKVFQVKDEQHTTELTTNYNYGVWDDKTIPLPESGSFKILFEGRLNTLGNEIAIDDITISGTSAGVIKKPEDAAETVGEVNDKVTSKKSDGVSFKPEGVSQPTEEQGGEEGTVKPEEVGEGTGKPEEMGEGTGKPEETGKSTEKPQEVAEGAENTLEPVKGTKEPVEVGEVTVKPEETSVSTNNSDNLMQGNNPLDVVESTDLPVQGNGTNNTDISEIIDNPDNGHESLNVSGNIEAPPKGNDTYDFTEASQYTLAPGEMVETGNVSNKTESADNANVTSVIIGNLDNFTEASGVNQTIAVNFTSIVAVTSGENYTEIENSTLPTNLTGITVIENSTSTNLTGVPANNVTNNHTNNLLDTSLNPDNVTTTSSVSLINQTGPMATNNATNITEAPTNINATGGGNNITDIQLTTNKTTPNISNPLLNGTTDQGNIINATTIPLIITNSTSPSGSNGSSAGNITGLGNGNTTTDGSDGVDGENSWSAFKVFLAICILGVVVMGFLYWRRQRRRDDEIPVFSRASHADYHNPTFTDDDANFASRGTGHNYKSFE